MDTRSSYSRFACVGTGVSGIGLGASLKRWYDEGDIRFFDRSTQPCGTWSINKYPGCACDVPSVLYSLSYEPNTEWSRVLPTNIEIERYLLGVARKYDLLSKMSLGVEVRECRWIEKSKRWRLEVCHLESKTVFQHECSVLFSAAGQLVYPREPDIPNIDNFKGQVFHSARWDQSADLKDKDVIVIGNGCTASQIVPAIVDETRSLTQIVRSKHWVFPPIDFPYPTWLKWAFKNIPLLQWTHRMQIFCLAEWEFQTFPMTARAARMRSTRRKTVEGYMRDTAPAKYHDLLIPDFDIGCKRRIYDSGYLKSLHSDKLTLTNAKALEFVPEGIRTTDGIVKADVVVLANGFRTNEFMSPLNIIGKNGELLVDHWKAAGGPEAYNCSAMNGFPNFFMILGPNTATGHTSTIMASENSINYALRILKPFMYDNVQSVEVKREAETSYTDKIQSGLQKTVWNSGCTSWYIRAVEKGSPTWNAMTYPYTQGYYWYRCLFPIWKDWKLLPTSRKKRFWDIFQFFAILSFFPKRRAAAWTAPVLNDSRTRIPAKSWVIRFRSAASRNMLFIMCS
ncbi:hypothetical protein ANO11243_097620 [Dothideomycetidae sp. 11243]|nr:hypothetical protein ANO11243_097620 [fungal sp. No.11243]